MNPHDPYGLMSPQFTLSDYLALPEGFPAQLVDGQLVKEPCPTYRHQYVSGMIYVMLRGLVGPGHVVFAPADVVLDDHNVFQPDVVVLRERPPLDQTDVGIPLIAIEVLSPSTGGLDRGFKTRQLLAAGVQEVWLVDATSRTIEVRTSGGFERAEGVAELVSGAVPGFALVPDIVFAT